MFKGKDKDIGDRDDSDESVGVGTRKKYPIHIVIMVFKTHIGWVLTVN